MSGFDDTERYICNNCGTEFTDPVQSRYFNGWEYACPYCMSEDFEQMIQCECCGNWVRESEAETDCYCSDCIKDSIKLMRDYMEHGKPMATDYRKVFLDYFDSL